MVTFDRPEAFLIVLPAAVLLVLLARGGRHAPRSRIAAFALRLTIVALVAGALAGPHRETDRPLSRRLVVLLDASDSVRDDARRLAFGRIAAVGAAEPDAPLRVLAFGSIARPLPWPAGIEDLARVDVDPSETDLARALAAALAEGGPDELLRVVLLTDGHATRGDALPAAAALRRAGAVLDVLPLPGPSPPDLAVGPRVLALDAPAEADADAPFSVRVHVDLAGDERADVVLRVDGAEQGRIEARADAGRETTVVLPAITLSEGSHRLEATLETAGPGPSRAVRVRPGPRVLVARDRPAPGPVEESLRAGGIPVRVEPTTRLREALAALGPADVLLLEAGPTVGQVVAALPELIGALRRGASLLLTADGGLADAAGTPLLPYLPLIPDVAPPPSPEEEPPDEGTPPAPGARLENVEKEAVRIGLLLIVDTSGSMLGEKIDMAKIAAWRAAQTLDPADRIAVIGFREEPYGVLMPTAAGDRSRIRRSVARMAAAGGTDIYPALRLGFETLRRMDVGVRHAILLSDGKSPYAPFRKLVEKAVADRITLSAVGIGEDFDSRLLAQLAEWGRGRFAWAKEPGSIPRIVTEDTRRVLPEGRGEPLGPPVAPPAEEPGPTEESPTEAPAPEAAPPEPLRVVAPHPALEGIGPDAIPPLGGIVPSKARAAAWVPLETAEDGRPVLAEWRVGLGRVLVLAGPLEGSGADAWRRWPDLGKVWVQAVRALAAASGPAGGPVVTVTWTPEATLVRAAAPPGGRGTPTLALAGGEGDRVLPVATPSPGVVEARLPRESTGRTLLLEARIGEGAPRALAVEVPARTRPEEAAVGTNRRALAALAEAAAGRLDPVPEDVPPSPRVPHRRPLATWLLLAAAVLLPLDVAVRRLPWLRE